MRYQPGSLVGFLLLALRLRSQRAAVISDLGDIDGSGGADAVQVSLFASGTDASGITRHFARRVLLNGAEIHAPTQESVRKRRAAR